MNGLDPPTMVLIVATGLVAGFFNAVAGGGSLLTLPLLIFVGIPAPVANGTNRVALLLQNIVAVREYARAGVHHFRRGGLLAASGVVGAVVGSSFAVQVDAETLRRVIGIVLLVVGVFVLIQPDRWASGRTHTEKRPWFLMMVFFFVGVYGGFIQAGIGFFILTALVVSGGYDLVNANAIKVLIILLYTIPALIIFALNGQVDWATGLLLSVGNMTGAWAGSRWGIRMGARWMRIVLLVAVFLAALRLVVMG